MSTFWWMCLFIFIIRSSRCEECCCIVPPDAVLLLGINASDVWPSPSNCVAPPSGMVSRITTVPSRDTSSMHDTVLVHTDTSMHTKPSSMPMPTVTMVESILTVGDHLSTLQPGLPVPSSAQSPTVSISTADTLSTDSAPVLASTTDGPAGSTETSGPRTTPTSETPTTSPPRPPSIVPYRCPARNCRVCSKTIIDCSNAGLRTVPIYEGNYSGILMLNLSYNQLSNLPENAFRVFTSLSRLELHGNLISSIHPGAFSGLRGLKFLYLDDNRLTFLTPVFGGLVNLQRLLLHQNQLWGIQPQAFDHLRSLTLLSLHENRFTYLNSSWFAGLTALKFLYLYDNQIADLSNSPFEILTSLTTLYLTNNSLEVIKEPYFKGLSALQILHLSSNSIASVGYRGMKPLANLQILYMISNKLSTVTSITFSDLIRLRVLFIQSNDISTIHRGAFFRLGLLERLEMAGNKMVRLDPNSLTGLERLEYLDLSDNKLDGLYFRSFYASKRLRFLYLINNSISCIEPRALAGSNIAVLNLGRNKLTSLRHDMFEGVTTLQAIYLYYNNITIVPKGVFDHTPQLRIIMLTFNQISTVEENAFQSPPLTTLYWDYQGSPGNEFVCDCNAQWLWKFLNNSNVDATITCASPERHAGQILTSLAYEDLSCGDGVDPSLTVTPNCSDVYVRPGKCVKLTCLPHPFMRVFWIRVDGELPQAIAPLGSVCQQGCSPSSQYDLIIPNVNVHHSGQYVCVAVHNNGMTTTKTCKVTVGVGPFFQSIPLDVSLRSPGPAVVFEVESGGTPSPSITWFRNGQQIDIASSDKYQQTTDGALIFTSTVFEDAGRYVVELSNPFGRTEYTVELYFRRSDACGGRCRNGGVCSSSCLCINGYTGTTCGIPPIIPVTTPPTSPVPEQNSRNTSTVPTQEASVLTPIPSPASNGTTGVTGTVAESSSDISVSSPTPAVDNSGRENFK